MNSKNIIVCGYQKSGTTWATRLVAELLNSPAAGYWNYDGKTFVVEGEKRRSNFKVFQSHQIYSELKRDNRIHKIVYIVRDPRDIAVSGIFHFNFYSLSLERFLHSFKFRSSKLGILLKLIDKKLHTKNYKIKRMIRMLYKGDPFIEHCKWDWNKHVSSFLEDKNVLIVRYEDLLLKSTSTCKDILSYLDSSKPLDQIKTDIESQSFKNKKKEFDSKNERIKSKHMRKGIAGDWKNNLSSEDIATICKNHSKVMEKINYL